MPAVLALSAVLLAGCDDEEQQYSLYFSHENHVNEYDAACSDCHGESEGGRFARPGHDSCVDCHEDWIDTEKITEKTCGQCHKARDLEELAGGEPPDARILPGGEFIHTEALAERCTECHGDLFGEKLYDVPSLDRAARVRIRDMAHGWDMACTDCHVDLDPETAPLSHDLNWERRHGTYGIEADNACAMCHTEQSCRDCHAETMPESHTLLWKNKTHGIEAGWDRERCQVCHEEDSCTACHQEVRPVSHNAAWRKNHCLNCHSSESTGTGCALCHEVSGPDSHPNPHDANWETAHCRSCHNGTPQGDTCNICHVDAGLDNHPNPHRGGYERSHCNSCHEGSTLYGVSCEACHGDDLLGGHPNPHQPGFARSHCSSCHDGATVNGVSCERCHGDDLLGNHPNPHPAGFANSHCNNCHADSTVNGISCDECHGNVADNHPNPHNAGYENSHCNTCHAGSPDSEQCEICHEGGSSVLVHEDFWPPVHDLFGEQGVCSDCHY